MRVEAGGDSAPLVEALRKASGDLPRTVAALWTWLEAHLGGLASHSETLGEIVTRAQGNRERYGEFRNFDDGSLHELAADPVPNAAELLARIAFGFDVNGLGGHVGGRAYDETVGFDGTPVIVVLRRPRLAQLVREGDMPPDAVENPSLTRLAPQLAVIPVELKGIRVRFVEPEGNKWGAAKDALEAGLAPDAGLCVHLDPLREHGLSGWHADRQRPVGYYDSAKMLGTPDEENCIRAAQEAVRAARGTSSVLLMPELAATPRVEAAVKKELKLHGDAPVLTVLGLYHSEPPPSEPSVDPAVSKASLAPYVNEAVVLGPLGEELWRQRKLSYAEARLPTSTKAAERPCKAGDSELIAEDIRVGAELLVVPTPLGIVGVAICLDAFAPRVRPRLEASGIEVVLVPSLSPRVERHRDSLQHVVQRLWGMALVCNRSPIASTDGVLGWNADETRSFWTAQRSEITVPPRWEGKGHPSFVFRLAERGTG